MTSWRQVKDVFAEAVERDGPEREAYLREACGPDAKLRAEVDRLLAYHEADDGLLDKPALSGKWLSAPVPEEHVFDVGETLAGRFEIVRFIGRGGMGEVYEAEDLELHERVALKTLLPEYSADPRHIARFRREVHVARRVKHPNVCKIHDVGRHRVGSSDITFLTMELLAGENLGDFLKREGKLEPTEAVPFFKQLGAGLQALHDQKIVHRDFKPGNIMLVPDENGKIRPVITDFGLARPANENSREHSAVTQPRHVVGTPDYMAPEHMAGQKVGSWSDIYSFGLVVCEALTGRHPFRRESREVEVADQADNALAELPGSAQQVVRRCLSAIPSERPTTPEQIVQAISVPGETKPSDTAEDPPLELEPDQGDRRRFLTRNRGLAAVVATAFALLLFGLRSQRQGLTFDGMVGSIQDNLCTRFPGQPLFCVLPPDRDIAFQSLSVEADTESDLAYGRGLSKFIGDSLYRLRSNQGEFCFHIRGDRPHLGVPLALSGDVQISTGNVRIKTELVRVSDGQILRRGTFERRSDDLYGLHEGLIRNFAELVGYELEPEQFASWLDEGPRDAAAFQDYLVGLGLIEEKQYKQVVERFRSALAGPQGGLAFAAAARGLGDANRYLFGETDGAQWARQAERAYRQAAAVNSVDLHRSRGMLEQAKGDHQAAVRQYERALVLNPFDYLSHINLIRSHVALGNREKANGLLQKGVEQKVSCWKVRNFMAEMQMRQGDYESSEKSLLEVIQLAPYNSTGYNNLSFLYLNEGRYDDVIDLAAQAIEKTDSPKWFVTLGMGYLYRGCVEDAILNFRHAVQEGPPDFVASYKLAEALLVEDGLSQPVQDAFQEAAALAEDALAAQEEDSHCFASRSLALLGRRPEALEHLADLERLTPSEDATALCAAAVYEALNEKTEALSSVRDGLERGATVFRLEQTPLSKEFRADARYLALLAEFGLEQTPASSLTESRPSAPCPQGTVAGLAVN